MSTRIILSIVILAILTQKTYAVVHIDALFELDNATKQTELK